jgi:hypothetical protein
METDHDEEEILRYELRYCEDVILSEFCVEMIFDMIKDILTLITDGYLKSR